MNRNRRSITIQDVARAAGVSVSTVSRVLNGKDDVAVETCEKVQGVIDELGYTSSLAARGMRSRRTNVIGLIMPDVASPYCIEVMRGVNQKIAQLDYDLIVYTTGDVRKYGTSLCHPVKRGNNRRRDCRDTGGGGFCHQRAGGRDRPE
jgi:LacI family transcriptional regulator